MGEKFDMKSYLNFVVFFLKIIGLWPKNLAYKFFNPYSIYLSSIIIYMFITMVIPAIIQLINVRNDLEVFADCLFLITSVIGGLIKMCFFVKNLPRIKTIMDCLDQDLYQPRNERQQSVMVELFKSWSFIFRLLWISANSTMVPLLISAINDRRLPSLAWYPFDYQQSPYYEILFVNQIIWYQYIAFVNVHLDGLFSTIMVYIASECKFLSDNLRNIEEFTRERLNRHNCRISDEYNNTLKILVGHHRGILMIAKETNTIFNISVAYQMCTSILGICMTMFRLSIAAPLTSEFFLLICYQFALFWEIFLYCWCGNEVTFASNEISLAGYESDWVDSSIQFKKDLLFFIRRTQKPIRLYALQFFTLSLETFINILRTSWSYFALLQQVNDSYK